MYDCKSSHLMHPGQHGFSTRHWDSGQYNHANRHEGKFAGKQRSWPARKHTTRQAGKATVVWAPRSSWIQHQELRASLT
jgi:hypothetical protein